jgi:hypothetical protein
MFDHLFIYLFKIIIYFIMGSFITKEIWNMTYNLYIRINILNKMNSQT